MKKITAAACLLGLALCAGTAAASDVQGLVTKQSPYSASETLDRLASILESNDVAVALRWDHAAKAEDVDIDVRDTEVMLFGDPTVGSHMFTSAQTAGIDLPMKAVAWTDAEGQTWLGYNDPEWLAERHGIDDRDDVVEQLSDGLEKLTDAATAEE